MTMNCQIISIPSRRNFSHCRRSFQPTMSFYSFHIATSSSLYPSNPPTPPASLYSSSNPSAPPPSSPRLDRPLWPVESERVEAYHPGGFHPVHLGNVLNQGRCDVKTHYRNSSISTPFWGSRRARRRASVEVDFSTWSSPQYAFFLASCVPIFSFKWSTIQFNGRRVKLLPFRIPISRSKTT